MSEEVIGKLESFTPTLPDRDAILFAAGRASAKPSPVWKRLAAVLATTQVLTLALWLNSRLSPPAEVSAPPSAEPTTAAETLPEPYFDPSSIYALSRNPERLSRSVAVGTAPGRSSLSAFSRELLP